MVKIDSNISLVKDQFKNVEKDFPTKCKIGDKEYSIEVQIKSKGTVELIGNRLLGGFLVLISLGLLYLCSRTLRDLFNPNKIFIKAKELKRDELEDSDKKAQVAFSTVLTTGIDVPKTGDKPFQDINLGKQKEQETPKENKEILMEVSFNESPYTYLPPEMKAYIQSYLPIQEFLQFSRVSKIDKTLVNIGVEKNEIRQMELLALLCKKNYPCFQEIMEGFCSKPNSLYPILLMLDKKIEKGTKNEKIEFKQVFKYSLDLLEQKKQFTVTFFKNLNSDFRQNVLDTVFRHFPKVAFLNIDMYETYASRKTKFELIKIHVNSKPSYKKYADAFYHYLSWVEELRKGVNFNDLSEKNAFYKLLLNLIFIIYQEYPYIKLEALSIIEKEMPDLTIHEFSVYVKEFINVSFARALPLFAAWKAIELCKKCEGAELRANFIKVYLELQKCCQVGDENERKEQFIYSFDKIIFKLTLKEEQNDVVRNLVYAINNMARHLRDDDLLSIFLRRLRNWEDEDLKLIALEKFARSWQEPSVLNMTTPPFYFLEKVEHVKALIHVVKDFEEPLRSIYLRFIAYGIGDVGIFKEIYLSDATIAKAFNDCNVEMPQGGEVSLLEILRYASVLSPFLNSLYEIKNEQDFINVLQKVKALPKEIRIARLSILANGIYSYETIKNAFASFNFDFDNVKPLSGEELNIFDDVFKKFLADIIFLETQNELLGMIIKFSHDKNKLYAIASSLMYCLNKNVVFSYEQKKKIFAENGLDIEEYKRIRLGNWIEIEEIYYYKK